MRGWPSDQIFSLRMSGRAIVHAAARDANRPLKVVAQRGQPADHPVLLDAPESEYLKCLIFALD